MTDISKLAEAIKTGNAELFKQATSGSETKTTQEKQETPVTEAKPSKYDDSVVQIQRTKTDSGESDEKTFTTRQPIVPGQFKTTFMDDGSGRNEEDQKLYEGRTPVPRRAKINKVDVICDRCNVPNKVLPIYKREIWVCDNCLMRARSGEAR